MDKNRKFQWIFLNFVINQCVVICQKLTENKNFLRLRDCGNQFLPQPSQNENGVSIDYFNMTVQTSLWLSWATQPNGSTVLEFDYFNLTSGWLLWTSQILGNKTNLRYLQSAAFPISNRHMFTSSQVVLTAEKKWTLDGVPFENCDKTIEVECLYVPKMLVCPKDNFDTMYTPLLLETEPLSFLGIPCLADDGSIKFKQDAEIHAYGLEGMFMTHRRV